VIEQKSDAPPTIMPCRTPGVRALAFSFRAAEWYDFCSLHLVRALVGAHGKSIGKSAW